MSLVWKGDEVSSEIRERAKRGVAMGANVVHMAAAPNTPMRQGLLRASFFALMPTVEGREIVSGLGTNLVYAARIHELPEDSNWTTPGTGPKYLENAMEDQKDNIAVIVSNYVKGVL